MQTYRFYDGKRELNRKALSMLKSAKSLRISWKVKRNKQIIKELFDIGYGIYEKNLCFFKAVQRISVAKFSCFFIIFHRLLIDIEIIS